MPVICVSWFVSYKLLTVSVECWCCMCIHNNENFVMQDYEENVKKKKDRSRNFNYAITFRFPKGVYLFHCQFPFLVLKSCSVFVKLKYTVLTDELDFYHLVVPMYLLLQNCIKVSSMYNFCSSEQAQVKSVL